MAPEMARRTERDDVSPDNNSDAGAELIMQPRADPAVMFPFQTQEMKSLELKLN